MTTAQDLPVEATARGAAPDPYPAEPASSRPPLALVPHPTDGDAVQFDEALRRARPKLHRYAIRRLQDRHEAEEVVQEALLRGYQHRDRLPTEDDLMAWLTVVTGRLVIDRLRVRGRSTPVAELPTGSRVARDTADIVVARDEARIALDALEAMPGRQAAVLWAREVEGLSYDEIGERYSLSEPTVRSLLHRARRTLRREYADRGGTLSAFGLVALAPWLRGLRLSSKLRQLVRKTGTAGAVAATGLAVATVAPIWSHPAPSIPAPAMRPLQQQAASVAPAHKAVAPARTTSHAPTTASTGRPRSGGPTTTPAAVPYHLPSACANGVGAGCGTVDRNDVVYLKLPVPVAGRKWVGVSSTFSCQRIPANPITACDQPQKDPK